MRYRVHCEFFIEADSPKQVEQFLGEDADFVEKHVIVEEYDPLEDWTKMVRRMADPKEEDYADIRERR